MDAFDFFVQMGLMGQPQGFIELILVSLRLRQLQ